MDIASFLNWLRLKDADSNLGKREIFEKQSQGVKFKNYFAILNDFEAFQSQTQFVIEVLLASYWRIKGKIFQISSLC